MTIADDVKTVLDNQNKLAAAVTAVATKIDGLPAGQTVDLTPELALLNQINADLSVTPTPAPAPEPAPAPAAS